MRSKDRPNAEEPTDANTATFDLQDALNLLASQPGTPKGEHDAAILLFQLIVATEQWWEGDGHIPSRQQILDCYAHCVAVTRGNSESLKEQTPTPNAGNSYLPVEPMETIENPAHGATQYAAIAGLPVPEQDVDRVVPLIDPHFSLKA